MILSCRRALGLLRSSPRLCAANTSSLALHLNRPTTRGSATAGTMASSSSAGAVLLTARDDHYGGVIVDADSLPADPDGFAAALECSLAAWAAAGKRGVWLKLPLARAALVPVAATRGGFVYHHAEPDYLMMTTWLQPEVPSTLPPNASHQVGVGAFVLNRRGEVLVVQENSGPLKGRQVWKMPTGLVATGEDVTDAVVREVREETGLRTRFVSVLALRQAHGFAFGKSDWFVLCALAPLVDEATGEEDPLVADPGEIEAVRWLPLAEYARQDFYKQSPLYQQLIGRCVAHAEGRYAGMSASRFESSFLGRGRIDLLLWGDDYSDSGSGGGGGGGDSPVVAAATRGDNDKAAAPAAPAGVASSNSGLPSAAANGKAPSSAL